MHKYSIDFILFAAHPVMWCLWADLCVDGSGDDVLDVAQQLVGFQQVGGRRVLEGQVALHGVCGSH